MTTADQAAQWWENLSEESRRAMEDEGIVLRENGHVAITEKGAVSMNMVGAPDAADNVRDWDVAPKARDLPRWRDIVLPCWTERGTFTYSTRQLKEMVPTAHDFTPEWELPTMSRAQLWFVGADMCDLLVSAAESLPETRLTANLIPDEEGFVFFEAPLAGLDANGSENAVTVGALLWGQGMWEDKNGKTRRCLAVTIYGPMSTIGQTLARGTGIPIVPLGGLVWPYGDSCDGDFTGDEARDKSMAEDRRRLLALWLLSSQPGLTSNVLHKNEVMSKAKKKRIAAGKAAPEPPIRIVNLRHRPKPAAGEPTRPEGGRTFRHRWAVSGHWRNQAYGKGRALHRPTYINPYLKGPEDAPLVVGEKVKVWK